MECRINAEDPVTFQPSPGKITKMHIQAALVLDTIHIFMVGIPFHPYYDSLLAKIITLANTEILPLKE